MTFKRTSEGRVFFQGADQAPRVNMPEKREAQERLSPISPSSMSPASKSAEQMPNVQMQILGLLRALNQKLQDSQTDRKRMHQELEAYRQKVEQLQGKARQSEQAYKSLEQRIGQGSGAAAPGKPDPRIVKTEMLAQELIKELEETRKLMMDLEDKAEKADKGVIMLSNQLSQTRQISEDVSRRQEVLEREQRETISRGVEETSRLSTTHKDLLERLSQTEIRQQELIMKVEETSAFQEKLSRKIEKSIEDRMRFMRKIERIEESLIQTRDALNARAMVLLTDQGNDARGESLHGAGDLSLQPVLARAPGGFTAAAPMEAPEDESVLARVNAWISQVGEKGAATFLVLALAAVILAATGWWMSVEYQNNSSLPVNEYQPPFASAAGDQETARATPAYDDAGTAQDLAAQEQDWSVSGNAPPGLTAADTSPDTLADTGAQIGAEETGETAEAGQADPVPAKLDATDVESELDAKPQGRDKTLKQVMETINDVGAIDLEDESKLEALLESNPSALGAALNKLEPSVKVPPPAAQARDIPAPKSPETKVAAIMPKTAMQDKALQPGQMTPVSPAEMARDRGLPASVKAVEEQAFAGVPAAQHDLAAIYTAGHGGVKPDYKRATFWFEKAAQNGVGNAAYNLGVIMHQGLGRKPDLPQAIKWYQKAATLGHPEAQYNLGIAYIEGVGVAYDAHRAATYFENAAAQGVMEAAYNLGLIYENGLLGQAAPDQALAWYKKAADKGSPEAKAALEQLARNLGIKVEDINRLVENTKAAQSH